MHAIRAHFDGRVIVPDEPVDVSPQAKVVVLLESEEGTSAVQLEQAVREYYQGQEAAERNEDLQWGEALARDSREAWDKE